MSDELLKGTAPGWLALGLSLSGCEALRHNTASLIDPSLQRSEVVGMLAGFGTTFAALPDLVAMLRQRSTAGMNPRMAAIMGVFQILWVYYGLLIASRPVVIWNLVAIVINFLSVGAFLYFSRLERTRQARAVAAEAGPRRAD